MSNSIDNNATGYPVNLVDAVFCCEYDWTIDDDHIAGLKAALETLTEREQQILKYRFEDCMTYEDVGKVFNVTRERIRQIEAKALRKLRHPARQKMIKHGLEGSNLNLELSKKEAELNVRESEIERRENRLIGLLNEIMSYAEEVTERRKKALKERTWRDLTVEELNLSVRSFNCLMRGDIHTAGEIANAFESTRIYNLRNMGRQSIKEVAWKLYDVSQGEADYNITPPEP